MPLVTTTFNQKTLIRIAMVIAFVQFTNALEYDVQPCLHLWLQISLFPSPSQAMYPVCTHLEPSCRELSPFTGLIVAIRSILIANMVLLAMATLLTTFTTSFPLLLTLRFFAGLVGGTTMAVGITILINHTG